MVICSIGSSSINHIDVEILRDTIPQWRLSCFYGMPERDRRRESWDLIRHLSSLSTIPWCIVGDFHDMLFQSDKEGKHEHPQFLMSGFRESIVDCELMEIDLSGGISLGKKERGQLTGFVSGWTKPLLLIPGGNCILSVSCQSIIQCTQITTIFNWSYVMVICQRRSFA